MSKQLVYILLLFIAVISISCNKEPVISKSQENFNLKVFGGSSNDSCNSIISDGDNLILTGSINHLNGPDMFLIKTDKYGNEVEWSPKLFGSSMKDVGNDITLDLNKNIILAGYSTRGAGESTDAFIVKTNSNGDELWSKQFGGPKNEKIYSILALPGIIWATGYTESVDFDIKKRQGWLLALSENGDSIWSHDYGTILVADELHAIVEMKDSLLLIGSTQSLFGNFKQDVFLFILKKSTKGIENSATLFRLGNETGISAIYDGKGQIIVLGYTQDNNSFNNIILWKLDENLQILNEKQIPSVVSETPSSIMLNNGSIIITGTAAIGENNDDFLVYAVDNNLNVISRNIYGSKGNQRGLSGTVAGRSVIFGGCTTSGNSSKACIFKTPEILP